MACSILESQKGELIGSNHDFNSILKVILCVVVWCVCFQHMNEVCVCVCSCVCVCVSSTLMRCVCVCFQHINELTMKLDLQSILCGAEAIYLQLTNCKVRRDRYDC